VNGQPLPYTTTVADVSTTITTGLVTIAPAGEWFWAMDGTRRIGAQTVQSPELIVGTWSAEGNALTFLSAAPPTVITATIAGDVLTFIQGGASYRFQR
jgi:hypothetical protein